jgi:hypothetical protein
MEQGAPQSLSPIERPAFSVHSSARWINGLWFTSLALSLAAALIAMLSKEWLTAFATSRPRSAHSYALLHQARLRYLDQWKALHIIDLLPTMLHLSLLLFSLGLAVYLWTLDPDIAIAEVLITGATLLFYLGTALLGAGYESCPFVTQISKYIQRILKSLFIYSVTLPCAPETESKDTKDDELRALVWLAKHARDPTIGGCAYQALAGLHISRVSISESSAELVADHAENALVEVKPAREIHSEQDDSQTGTPNSLKGRIPDRYVLLSRLFETLCTRLSEARLHQPQDLTACRGINVARYAGALPTLVDALEAYRASGLAAKSSDKTKSQTVCTTSAKAVPAFKF